MSTKRTIIAASVVAASATVVLALAMSLFSSGNSQDEITYIPKRVLTLTQEERNLIGEASTTATCGDTLADVKSKAPFPVMTPTVMVSGYSLKGADATADRVQLFYHDGEVCGENAETLVDGVIQLVAGPLNTVADARNGKDFTEIYLAKYRDSGIDARTYELPNGMYAVGYPSGVGTSHYVEDGEEAFTTNYDYPASIWVIDDTHDVAYRLKAFLPLEDLVKIGGSLEQSS